MRKLLLVLATTLATACLSTGPTEVGLGQEFELAPSQSAKVIGTSWTVAFRGVSGDTRCPVDRLCLVAGDAGIRVDVFGSAADNPIVLNTAAPHDRWSDDGLRLRVVELFPAVVDDQPINPADYRVRLVVEAVGS